MIYTHSYIHSSNLICRTVLYNMYVIHVSDIILNCLGLSSRINEGMFTVTFHSMTPLHHFFHHWFNA